VADIELLEAKHASAALCQVIRRRAAHPADSDHDGIERHAGVSKGEIDRGLNAKGPRWLS
jgi:hypothetical protein